MEERRVADPPFLEVVWNDRHSDARGYVVLDRLVGRFATGGIRMRSGCSLDEVGDLARRMSLKTGILDLPVGGGKGGIDFDPQDPRAREVLTRYVRALRPLLEAYWTAAEDLGVSQALLDEVFDELGLGMSLHAALRRSDDPSATLVRVRAGYAAEIDGLRLADVVGGYGVAEATLAALSELDLASPATSAVIQGFGSIGGATARYLDRAGVRVVGVVDARGCIVDHDGLDVDALLAARTPHGEVERTAAWPEERRRPRGEWLEIGCDVLIPAAVSYAITAENHDRVNTRIVVEAANAPTTPEAERRLLERGVPVVPDFVANAGAAGWAWWTLLGETSVPPERVLQRLSAHMWETVPALIRAWRAGEATPREVAATLSRRNHERHFRELGETEASPAIP